MTHVKTGSAALTVCANETAPAPRAMTEPAWPMAWAAPMGARVFQPSALISGVLRMPVAHSSRTKGTPTPSELSDIIQGMAKALSTRLLLMLYLVRVRMGVRMRVRVG
jgi:hypothetical protein